MGLLKGIHHIGLVTKSIIPTCNYLSTSFGFEVNKSKESSNKYILRSKDAYFTALSSDNYDTIDSVFDIALEVTDVSEVINRAKYFGVDVISESKKIISDFGNFETAKIKSIVGNVVHTIINSQNNQSNIQQNVSSNSYCQFVNKFDHITYAVNRGMSDNVINWYSKMFDMKRIQVNNLESLDTGFIIRHKDKGMLLKAFDYWKCSKAGVESIGETCKFIIAEELSEFVPNQIGTFLREHNGPGVQHIGLLVDDILTAARRSSDDGAVFMRPPDKYYDNILVNPDIRSLNLPIDKFAQFGILVDSELSENNHNDNEKKYLMQIFTRPIFDRDTFFLELIERHGAQGFGAGNIKALWDAVDAELCGHVNN